MKKRKYLPDPLAKILVSLYILSNGIRPSSLQEITSHLKEIVPNENIVQNVIEYLVRERLLRKMDVGKEEVYLTTGRGIIVLGLWKRILIRLMRIMSLRELN